MALTPEQLVEFLKQLVPGAGLTTPTQGLGQAVTTQAAGQGTMTQPTVPAPVPQVQEITKLTPQEESRFQSWVKANKITDLDHPDSHYDYRGYWKEFGDKPVRFGVDHFTDRYKQHGHPTFSRESKYSTGANDGGTWNGDTYIPPRSMIGPDAIAQQWQQLSRSQPQQSQPVQQPQQQSVPGAPATQTLQQGVSTSQPPTPTSIGDRIMTASSNAGRSTYNTLAAFKQSLNNAIMNVPGMLQEVIDFTDNIASPITGQMKLSEYPGNPEQAVSHVPGLIEQLGKGAQHIGPGLAAIGTWRQERAYAAAQRLLADSEGKFENVERLFKARAPLFYDWVMRNVGLITPNAKTTAATSNLRGETEFVKGPLSPGARVSLFDMPSNRTGLGLLDTAQHEVAHLVGVPQGRIVLPSPTDARKDPAVAALLAKIRKDYSISEEIGGRPLSRIPLGGKQHIEVGDFLYSMSHPEELSASSVSAGVIRGMISKLLRSAVKATIPSEYNRQLGTIQSAQKTLGENSGGSKFLNMLITSAPKNAEQTYRFKDVDVSNIADRAFRQELSWDDVQDGLKALGGDMKLHISTPAEVAEKFGMTQAEANHVLGIGVSKERYAKLKFLLGQMPNDTFKMFEHGRNPNINPEHRWLLPRTGLSNPAEKIGARFEEPRYKSYKWPIYKGGFKRATKK